MNVFLDTNVVIDFMGEREGFFEDAAASEANLGVGMKFPKLKILHLYFKWGLPIIISVIFVLGYMQKFAPGLYNKIFE